MHFSSHVFRICFEEEPAHGLRHENINIVPFVSVDCMMKLVLTVGVETFLRELAGYIEADFKRWELFDKTRARRLTFERRRHRADADQRRQRLRLQICQWPSEEYARTACRR